MTSCTLLLGFWMENYVEFNLKEALCQSYVLWCCLSSNIKNYICVCDIFILILKLDKNLTLAACDSSSVYEEGRFCETFHLNASGWRCCETCGKVSQEFFWFINILLWFGRYLIGNLHSFNKSFGISSLNFLIVNLPLQQVHCGCIVSSNAFTLLDPGGIECMKCARKNVLWVWVYLAFPINLKCWPFFMIFLFAVCGAIILILCVFCLCVFANVSLIAFD